MNPLQPSPAEGIAEISRGRLHPGRRRHLHDDAHGLAVPQPAAQLRRRRRLECGADQGCDGVLARAVRRGGCLRFLFQVEIAFDLVVRIPVPETAEIAIIGAVDQDGAARQRVLVDEALRGHAVSDARRGTLGLLHVRALTTVIGPSGPDVRSISRRSLQASDSTPMSGSRSLLIISSSRHSSTGPSSASACRAPERPSPCGPTPGEYSSGGARASGPPA
jgi:hypothetical protein